MMNAYALVRYKFRRSEIDDMVRDLLIPPLSTDENLEIFTTYQVLNTYFEGLGILVKEKLLDVALIENLLKRRIQWFWEYTAPYYDEIRQRTNDPTMFENFEYLYNEVMKHQQCKISL
jgi:hypothetical protein